MGRKGIKMLEDPKQCTFCMDRKPRSEFRPIKNKKNSVYSVCMQCEPASARKWREDNKEKIQAINRKARLKKAWGMSPESFNDLLAKQGGGCAICGATIAGGKGTFKVDHCHSSGVIRGLLCQFCNVGLGHFRDSPNLLTKAISYLKKSRVKI